VRYVALSVALLIIASTLDCALAQNTNHSRSITNLVVAPLAPVELPPGTLNFTNAGMGAVLEKYQELSGWTVIRPTPLPRHQITFRQPHSVTRLEALQLLEAIASLNDVALIPQGTNLVKAVCEQTAPLSVRSCSFGLKHDWTIRTWKGADGSPQAIGIVEWGGKSTILVNSFSLSLPVSAPVLAGALTTVLSAVLTIAWLGFRKRPA
jgi:hypothetical protein